MNVLLIYPKFPETFWSFTYALRKISILAFVDMDGCAKAQAASVGGHPGHLRPQLPEVVRSSSFSGRAANHRLKAGRLGLGKTGVDYALHLMNQGDKP
jgi:hypothetical protein